MKLDCQPCWTKHRSSNDYMNNYIKIYRMVQCKEAIWLWIHPTKWVVTMQEKSKNQQV